MLRNNLAYAFRVMQPLSQDAPARQLPAALLLDTIARGVIVVNADGILTFINKYAGEALHVQQETVIGKRVDMLPLRTPLYKVLSEQCRDAPLEMAVNGRVIAAQTTAVSSDDGVAHGELTELWDITEERRAKREWEEFVAMMTHDLRSPLTVMMGYIQGMLCGMFGEVGSRLRKVAEEAEESGKKLNAMIEEILDNFRLETGLLHLNRQSCDMGEILDSCCQDNLRAAQGQGINLVLARPERLPEMQVDCRQLTRVFNNLIGNAIKYTTPPGKVTVTAELTADALVVSVADTGIGIPPEDLSRIFYKYYRSAGASGFKGTGLGLAISKSIAEAHGGGIEVESTIGSGSMFKVSIPLDAMDEYNV